MQEYQGEQSQHVLNGFEFALLGLHDLADRSDTARDLWNAGVASLVARIGVYDIPSARTQLYAALNGGRLQVAGTGYQHWHAILTRTLATLTGEQTLADYANRWEQYERQPAARQGSRARAHPRSCSSAGVARPAGGSHRADFAAHRPAAGSTVTGSATGACRAVPRGA